MLHDWRAIVCSQFGLSRCCPCWNAIYYHLHVLETCFCKFARGKMFPCAPVPTFILSIGLGWLMSGSSTWTFAKASSLAIAGFTAELSVWMDSNNSSSKSEFDSSTTCILFWLDLPCGFLLSGGGRCGGLFFPVLCLFTSTYLFPMVPLITFPASRALGLTFLFHG